MNFCEECGVLVVPGADGEQCTDCNPTGGAPILSRQAETVGTELEKLFDEERCYPKKNAVKWLRNCERPSSSELKRSMLPKPARFEGSTFETDISNIRVTGDAQFIETIAGLLKPILILKTMRHVLN